MLDNCFNQMYNYFRKTKGGDKMTDSDRKILTIFMKIIPKLSEQDKERLLAFGEGLCFKVGVYDINDQKHNSA